MKVLLVAGARPNFMKIAPIIRAMKAVHSSGLTYRLVHTGQHYDDKMSDTFFKDLEIPAPDFFLNAGSGSHAEQTSHVMLAFETLCITENPDCVLVVGDVNSTLACSIVAKKLSLPVVHVEAGLRSFDMDMPEEVNRVVTDAITDIFFTTEASAKKNLMAEGKSEDKIHLVGHVMVDNLLYQLRHVNAMDSKAFQTSPLKQKLESYIFLTLHRPSNVDNKQSLAEILTALNEISQLTPIVFPVHPRTRKMIDYHGIKLSSQIHVLEPLGFRESLFLWKDALMVFTDSGGLQEETTALGVPCYTIRENTERPVTVEEGTNSIIGNSGRAIRAAYKSHMAGSCKKGSVPRFWDGFAAERIVRVLLDTFELNVSLEKTLGA